MKRALSLLLALVLASTANAQVGGGIYNPSSSGSGGGGVTSITGTANQVIASGSTGAVTLSTPQNINSGASPTFASMALSNDSNQLVLGTTHPTTITTSSTTARTLTLPNTTTILVGRGETATIENKTLDFTNVIHPLDSGFSIAASGDPSSFAVFDASGISDATTRSFKFPDANTTLVGTDATQTLTNKSIAASEVNSGTLPAAQLPAFTGDVTTSAGAVATTIANNAVTNAKAAQMAANTIKGNNTGSTANAADLTVPQVEAMLTAPSVTVLTTGSGTYTTPTNTKYLLAEGCGSGAGGAGSGTSAVAGHAGGNTTFGTSLLTGNAGTGGTLTATVAAGGTASGGDINQTGANGGMAAAALAQFGGHGGGSYFGGGGAGGSPGANVGDTANSFCAGGGGAASGTATNSGGGGAAGGYFRKLITSPLSTYSYSIGAAGTAGAAGTSGANGGAGGGGIISVTAYFQ